jgi:hypothetical protein
MGVSARNVRYEHRASEAWDRLQVAEPRFEEIQRGMEWTLARRPDIGVEIPGAPGVYVLFSRGKPWGITPYVFFYRFGPQRVDVLDIIKADQPED